MVAPHSPPSDKDVLREAMRRRRQGCDPELGTALVTHVLAAAAPPAEAIVAGYWPIRREIDPRPLLTELSQRGHRIVLPVTPPLGNPLIFKEWKRNVPLRAGRFGTHEPEGEELVPDWLLVPLLAFDRRGFRLGYGGGYYDRTLVSLPRATAIGCAYGCQEIPAVPTGPHDQRLSAVATEDGLLFFGRD